MRLEKPTPMAPISRDSLLADPVATRGHRLLRMKRVYRLAFLAAEAATSEDPSFGRSRRCRPGRQSPDASLSRHLRRPSERSESSVSNRLLLTVEGAAIFTASNVTVAREAGMRVAVQIELPEADREKLQRWATSRSAAVRLRERSRIVLLASEGLTNKAIARELGIDTNKTGRWRRRYAGEGLKGIEKERPRRGNYGGKDSRAQAD